MAAMRESTARATRGSARFGCRAASWTGAISRCSLVLLALLALAIQSLVIQPHIHAQLSDAALASIAIDGPDDSDHGAPAHNPIDPDQSDCPLCQSAHQGGHYLKPNAAVFALDLSVNYRTIDLAQATARPQRASHSWQGRAPPQA